MEVAAAIPHETQHRAAYINMVSNIANILITKLTVDPHENDDDFDEQHEHSLEFTNSMPHQLHHDLANPHAVDIELRVVEKSASLLHSEDIIWLLLTKEHTQNPTTQHQTFGPTLFQSIPPTVTYLSQVLEMLCKADTSLFCQSLIFHITSIVAFQHYVRLVVLGTGQFAPQRTMNIQQS